MMDHYWGETNYWMHGVGWGPGVGQLSPWLIPLALGLLATLWSIFWKGLALWHSAKREQGWWFIVLLLVNTLGILELVYLFFILKLKSSELFPHRN